MQDSTIRRAPSLLPFSQQRPGEERPRGIAHPDNDEDFSGTPPNLRAVVPCYSKRAPRSELAPKNILGHAPSKFHPALATFVDLNTLGLPNGANPPMRRKERDMLPIQGLVGARWFPPLRARRRLRIPGTVESV